MTHLIQGVPIYFLQFHIQATLKSLPHRSYSRKFSGYLYGSAITIANIQTVSTLFIWSCIRLFWLKKMLGEMFHRFNQLQVCSGYHLFHAYGFFLSFSTTYIFLQFLEHNALILEDFSHPSSKAIPDSCKLISYVFSQILSQCFLF